MIVQNGRAWVKSFQTSVELYKNVARMLQAADDIMRLYSLYPDNSSCIVPKKQNLEDFNAWPMWLPEFVFRQYQPATPQNDIEIVTVAAVLHLTSNPDFPEPLCIASRVRLSEPDPVEVCWIPVLQAYHKNPMVDGKVYEIEYSLEDFHIDKDEHQRVNAIVKAFLSVACPLFNITNSNELKDKLIDPLLCDSR